uniref:Uncharacterized protein n=1 Tax=Bactrocera dorsalis TaxID=27457 RepID=A0A034V7R9_BACDO
MKHMHQQFSYAKVARTNNNKTREETMEEWKHATLENTTTTNNKMLAFPTNLDKYIQKQDDFTTKINQTINNCLMQNATQANNKALYEALIYIQSTLKQMTVSSDLWKINKK